MKSSKAHIVLTREEALKIANKAMADINAGKYHPMIWEEHTVERDHVFGFLQHEGIQGVQ